MDAGDYGLCVECGEKIATSRLDAYPYADECIDCAEFDEHRRRHM
jgi:DnaK suppressor protein